jgi:hypothetical protein
MAATRRLSWARTPPKWNSNGPIVVEPPPTVADRGTSLTYPDSRIVLVGESLGAAVAVQVAFHVAARPPSRPAPLAPWLSLAATVARDYRCLQAQYFVKDRFDAAGPLVHYKGAIGILSAGNDEAVGAAQGRALATLSQSRGDSIYVEPPEAGHNSGTTLITDAQWTELLGTPPVPGGH